MSKCEKCKKGDMHFVNKITIMPRGETICYFMCDKCGEFRTFPR